MAEVSLEPPVNVVPPPSSVAPPSIGASAPAPAPSASSSAPASSSAGGSGNGAKHGSDKSSAVKKRKKTEEEDEDEEDAEDEDDEELDDDDEEDEDEAGDKQDDKGKKKKKKKMKPTDARYFMSLEAEVDEEGEDEDEEGEEELGGGKGEDLSEEEEANAADLREQRKNYLTSLVKGDQEINEEMLRDRYRDYDESVEEMEYQERDDIRQQSLLPTVRDPKLWMLRCKPGLENLTVISLLQKYVDLELDGGDNRLLIKSAVAPAHLKGHIYVEAEKEAHVKEAIKGLRNLFAWSSKLVPLGEMVDVLKVPVQEAKLTKGSWVRVKRGVYSNDIAQVVDSDVARGRATVKLVPRLDLQYIKKLFESAQDPAAPPMKKVRTKAPPPKFFNAEEIRALGMKDLVERKRDGSSAEVFEFFQGARFKDGYLYKTMNLKSLEWANIVPTIDELQRFQNRGDKEDEEDDLEVLARTRPKRKVTFAKGDTVKVVEGDLKHLMGVVESIEEDSVTIMPKHQDLHELLSFPSAQLQKHFKEGDHVKVVAGRYEGEVGLVLRVEDNVVVLFSDATQKELKVLAADLQACSEVSTGRLELGNYELHDLVQLDTHTVGMIVRVEREAFKVLDNNGNVRTVRLQEMGAKKNMRGAQAFDAHSNPVSVGDVVQVLEGKNKGKQGTIKNLYRYFVFVWSREVLDNSGVFVERTSNLAILGGGKGSSRGLGPSPLLTPGRGPLQSPGSLRGGAGPHARLQGGMGGLGRGGGGGMMGGGRGRGRGGPPDPFMAQTVRVVAGPWKGYVGLVRDTTETTCRIELHTNCKTVTVDKDKLRSIQKDTTPSVGPAGGYHAAPRTPSYDAGSRTPMYDVLRTPMRDADPSNPLATPNHPSTPMRDAWDPQQPNTPAHTPGAWERDETGGGGAGHSWTPAEGYSAQTPTGLPYGMPSTFRDEGGHHTPGTGSSHHPYTPNFDTPGSAASSYDQRTPRDSTPHGGAFPGTPSTPSGSGVPPTPSVPSAGEYFGGAGGDEAKESLDWYERDIEVKIINDQAGREHLNKKAALVEARADSCVVRLTNGDLLTVPKASLEPVIPAKKDKIKVTSGKEKGATGVLIGIDGNDAIVKMDADADIKILTMARIARWVDASKK